MTSPIELKECSQYYLQVWTKAAKELLGWDEGQTRQWAKRFDDDLEGKYPFFYHESPVYYLSPELIPDRLRKALPHMALARLAWRIQEAIEQGALPPLPGEICALKDHLSEFEWMERVNQFTREVVREGYGISPESLDRYDWRAARQRIESVLEQQ